MEELFKESLPSPWNYAAMNDGRVFFIDEESQTTSWLHPVYGHPVQSGHYSSKDMPIGWEMSYTPYGIPYYINHLDQVTTDTFPRMNPALIGAIDAENLQGKAKFEKLHRSNSKRRSGKKFVEKLPTVKRSPYTQVTRRGWIYKQESTPLKPWKKRWFVLAEFCLFHYKGSEEGQCLGSVLLPSYRISTCDKDEDGISRKFAFKAEHENVKTLFFSTETHEDMSLWIDAMRLAATAELPAGNEGQTNLVTVNNESSMVFRHSQLPSEPDKLPQSVRTSVTDLNVGLPSRDNTFGRLFPSSEVKPWQHDDHENDSELLRHKDLRDDYAEDIYQPRLKSITPPLRSNPLGDSANHSSKASLPMFSGGVSLGHLVDGGGEEGHRSKDNLVDVSGGRLPLLSKSDSKNQDIINWLGISSRSSTNAADISSDEEDVQIRRPSTTGSLYANEIRQGLSDQNKQDLQTGLPRDVKVRDYQTLQSIKTRENLSMNYEGRDGVKFGVENSRYDINRVPSSDSSSFERDEKQQLEPPMFSISRNTRGDADEDVDLVETKPQARQAYVHQHLTAAELHSENFEERNSIENELLGTSTPTERKEAMRHWNRFTDETSELTKNQTAEQARRQQQQKNSQNDKDVIGLVKDKLSKISREPTEFELSRSDLHSNDGKNELRSNIKPTVDPQWHTEELKIQPKNIENSEHLNQLGSMAECKSVLSEHRKLRSTLVSSNRTTARSDQIVKQLITIRRSQARLEESRYLLLNRLYQLPEQSGVVNGNDADDSLELNQQIVEVETEISLTNQLVVLLECKLTNRRVHSQLSNREYTRATAGSHLQAKSSSQPDELSSYMTSETTAVSSAPKSPLLLSKQDASLLPSSHSDEKLTKIRDLQRNIEEKSSKLSQLREEKAGLIKSLYKAQKNEDEELDAQRRMQLRQTRQSLDRDLFAAQRKMENEAKRLDEMISACSCLEEEVNLSLCQQQQQLGQNNAVGSMSRPPTFDSLHNVPKASPYSIGRQDAVISELQSSLNRPTSIEAHLNKSTYLETDLDSGCCRDLAASAAAIRLPAVSNRSELSSVSRPFVSDLSVTNMKTSRIIANSPGSVPNQHAQSLKPNMSDLYSPLRYQEAQRDENKFSGDLRTDAVFRSRSARALGNTSGNRNTQSLYASDVRPFDEQELRFRSFTMEPRSNVNKTFGRSSGQLLTVDTNHWQTTRTQEVGRSVTLNPAGALGPSNAVNDTVYGTRYSAGERLNVNPKVNLNRLYAPKLATSAAPGMLKISDYYHGDYADHSRELERGRGRNIHSNYSANRSRSVPRTAHSSATTARGTLSEDEDDLCVGFNTVDRARRLSGLYTPRPFIGSQPIANNKSATPASASSHLYRAASAGLIHYNAAEAGPDELAGNQLKYATNDFVLPKQYSYSIEAKVSPEKRFKTEQNFDRQGFRESMSTARYQGMRTQVEVEGLRRDQTPQRSRPTGTISRVQPSVQENIRRLLENGDDGSCL